MKKVIPVLVFLTVTFLCFTDSGTGGQTELNNLFIEACKFASLHDAVKYHDLGADINAVDDFGWSALMWASQDGNTEIVNYLLENGSDLNYKDTNSGWTALIADCFKGRTDVVSLLVNAGANVNPDISGYSNISSPLQYAKRFGFEEIEEILIAADAE